jgi:hypothetical protein
MKKFLVLASLVSSLAFSCLCFGETTKDGYPACLTKEWLDDLIVFVAADDVKSINAYISMKRCVVLKGGIKVTVTDSSGLIGTQTQFAYMGIKFWTLREGLTR